MKALKPHPSKRLGRSDRERKVLLGLVEHYIKTGKPVGSHTLKEAEFADLSSATLRNYFAKLEEEGFLDQQHSSGGRIPTTQAFKLYANEVLDAHLLNHKDEAELNAFARTETRAVHQVLQEGAELLSRLTQGAVFLSAPRFDQDFVLDLRIVVLDHTRCLCVIVTHFGLIQTEVLQLDKKLSAFSTKRIEAYFQWRLKGIERPENLTAEEERLGQEIYNEVMVRYIVNYTHFSEEEVHRTGFSKLLIHPEFQDPQAITSALALFENLPGMRRLLKETSASSTVKLWLGEDILPFAPAHPANAVLAIPYQIHNKNAGAIGVILPIRTPYKRQFSLLRRFSEVISETLTHNLYKFKISYRQPHPKRVDLTSKPMPLLEHGCHPRLEDQRTP